MGGHLNIETTSLCLQDNYLYFDTNKDSVHEEETELRQMSQHLA